MNMTRRVLIMLVALTCVLSSTGCFYHFVYVRGTGAYGSLAGYRSTLRGYKGMAVIYKNNTKRVMHGTSGWEYFTSGGWEGYALFIKRPSMGIKEARAAVLKKPGKGEYKVQYYYKDSLGINFNHTEKHYGRAVIDKRSRMILVEVPSIPGNNLIVGYVTKPKSQGVLF